MGVTLRVPEHSLLAEETRRHPYVAACDEHDCYFIVSARSEEMGREALGRHKCPYGGSELPNYPSCVLVEGKSRSLHELLWETLDSVIDGLMLAKSGKDETATMGKVTFLKGRASGLATAIMWIASPYFNEIKDVSRWAMERYKMRVGEREFEPTIGCDRYDPLRDEPTEQWVTKVEELRRRNGALAKRNEAPRPAPPVSRAAKSFAKLDPEVEEGIKRAFTVPAMTDDVIANMFTLPVQQVAQLRASQS